MQTVSVSVEIWSRLRNEISTSSSCASAAFFFHSARSWLLRVRAAAPEQRRMDDASCRSELLLKDH